MPRAARVVIGNYPHHIIQRGHNKEAVFASDKDYLNYLQNLQELKEDLSCKVYGYCLMSNHVHLIMNPGEKAENMSLLMKGLAGRQTRYVNKVYEKSGTLWEGRYKSSLICGDEYLLACSRYVELNPVRAGIVDEPGKYQWSSYRSKVGMEDQNWLDLDPWYLGLGNDQKEREEKYEKLVREMNLEEGYGKIRLAIQRGQLTGSKQFEEEIAGKIGRRVSFRGQGRPSIKENHSYSR